MGIIKCILNAQIVFHKGKVVGDGAYCSALPETARKFAGKCNIKGEIYYIAFMLRVIKAKLDNAIHVMIQKEIIIGY